ncbi:GNAT family N-acetyltransferase (plasmid) [Embleya sp. NBC_00888]|uniref:GNAT family N-acetyltransferase n=1 Tax=Embleya sp. NBC_00888 TaxID=2975960 RepID=UPI002F90B0E7|nr:GNAT family N-acetyltransferase [Embleya sp. NBC_00888]
MSAVIIRELHELHELEDAFTLFCEIWGTGPGNAPMSVEQMRALSHAGNYVAGAYAEGRMIGATVGFFGAPIARTMHSHITGARPGHAAGFALKLHQRNWALARGVTRITWTYDPLIRRNAHFNVTKLAGRPDGYLPNFYGSVDDAINGGTDTDRALVIWDLSDPGVVAAANLTPIPFVVPAGAVAALSVEGDLPVLGRTDADHLLVEVPADIEKLRRTDPGAAKDWRIALREVLGGLLADGARVIGFQDKSRYVLTRDTAA